MLENAYLLAKIGADTAENERNFAKILIKIGTTLRVPPGGGPGPRGSLRGAAAPEKRPSAAGSVCSMRPRSILKSEEIFFL